MKDLDFDGYWFTLIIPEFSILFTSRWTRIIFLLSFLSNHTQKYFV